jgi:hypothetical protein
MIFQPHMLDFWSSFDPAKGFELKDMVHISYLLRRQEKHTNVPAKYPAFPVVGVISRTPFSSVENNVRSGCRWGN